MVTLSFIGSARSKDLANQIKNTNFFNRGFRIFDLGSFLDLGMDLIINNRNLYVGYDYANKNGLAYGKGMFRYLFATFPCNSQFND